MELPERVRRNIHKMLHAAGHKPRAPRLMSTGQAAKLFSVKPDTVLKWIKKGRLEATRTPGGHYRIEEERLRSLPCLPDAGRPLPLEPSPSAGLSRPLRCWEYLSERGEIRQDCLNCVVYRVRAAWCFEVIGLGGDVGHAMQFCGTTCENCAYYQRVTGQAINALIVTSDDELIRSLRTDPTQGISLRFARNGYETSAIIGDFRPAFVVVDEEVVIGGEPGLLDCLAGDPRVPGLKIVLAAESGTASLGSRKDVVRVIEKPFDKRGIAAVIHSFPVEALPAGARLT